MFASARRLGLKGTGEPFLILLYKTDIFEFEVKFFGGYMVEPRTAG
jgi:hypothetical protein